MRFGRRVKVERRVPTRLGMVSILAKRLNKERVSKTIIV